MSTQKPPFWWRGTPEEWNRIPVGDRELVRSMSNLDRDNEAARLLAVARNEHYKPEQARAKSETNGATSEKVARSLTGIRNWTESVNGISAERIRDCIIFLLDVKKDPWYLANCNNRAFVHRFASKMDEQTPEDYHYNPNAVLGSRRQHVDGENQPVIITVVQKKVGELTDKDRKELREKYQVCDATIKYLAKPDCKKCYGKGFVDVFDYPDEPRYAKLTSSEACTCVWE